MSFLNLLVTILLLQINKEVLIIYGIKGLYDVGIGIEFGRLRVAGYWWTNSLTDDTVIPRACKQILGTS